MAAKFSTRSLLASLGLLLYLSSVSPIATAQPLSQIAPLDCVQQRQQDLGLQINELLNDARQQIDRNQPVSAASLYRRAIRFARSSQMAQIQNAIGQEIAEDTEGSSYPFGRMIAQLGGTNRTEAEALLNEALMLVRSLDSGYSFNKTRALTQIARHYQTVGQVETARSILTEAIAATRGIQGTEFQTIALTGIATQAIALEQRALAAELLARSLTAAQQIQATNPDQRGKVLLPIVIAFAQLGEIEQATQIAQTIPGISYYKSTALAAIGQQHLKTNQPEVALKVVQTIPTPEIQANGLAEVAAWYGNAGRSTDAKRLFAQAIQTVQRRDNADYLITTLVTTIATAGQLDLALAGVAAIKDAEQRSIALARLSTRFAQANRPDAAKLQLAQAIATAQTIPDPNRQTSVLSQLVETALQANQFDQAFQIAQTLKEDTYPNNRSDVLLRVANRAIDAGKYDFALQVTEAIAPGWVDYRSQAIRRIALAYAQQQQFDRALQLAQKLDNFGSSPYQVRTLAAIAAQLHQAGKVQEANQRFAEATQRAQAAKGFQAQAIAAVALELLNANQPDRAKLPLTQALLLTQAEDVPSSSYTLRTIAEQFLAANQPIAAIQVVQAMRDPYEKSSRLLEIATRLIEQQQYEAAQAIVPTLPTPETQVRLLITLATALIQDRQIQATQPILTQATQLAQTVPGPEVKTIVVKAEYDGQGNIISKTEVDDDHDRASLLAAIAILYARSGRLEQAQQAAQRIQTASLRQPLQQRLTCHHTGQL